MESYSLISSILLAFGLSAACGFKFLSVNIWIAIQGGVSSIRKWLLLDRSDWVIAVLALTALIEITEIKFHGLIT